MNKKQTNRLVLHLLLLLCALPNAIKSQSGANDPAFNTVDNTTQIKGTNGAITAVAIQPDKKMIIAGDFTSYNGKPVNRIVRLNTDGSPDVSFKPGTGTNDKINTVCLQADKKFIITGHFTSYNGKIAGHIARVNTKGTIDNTFKTGTGTNGAIVHALIQPDGKIIIGGNFTDYNGTAAKGLIRLNSNGSRDNTFTPGDSLLNIIAMCLLADGKIMIGFQNNYDKELVRLNTDGSRDTTFTIDPQLLNNPFLPTLDAMAVQAGDKVVFGICYTRLANKPTRIYRLNANGEVDTEFNYDLAEQQKVSVSGLTVQADGKIIIAGKTLRDPFTNDSANYITRLNLNGDKDPGFTDPTLQENEGVINSAFMNTDGRITILGTFSKLYTVALNNIARLNHDGSLDVTFNKTTGANGNIHTTSIQTNGKIIIGGNFSSYNTVSRNHIARLNQSGSLDGTFNTGTGTNGPVYASAIQSNGKIIIGGRFTDYNGAPRKSIARLNTNGNIDAGFNVGTGINGSISAIAVQANGQIIIGGTFTDYNGVARQNIVRLQENGTIDSLFDPLTNGIIMSVNSCAVQTDGKIVIAGIFYIDNYRKNIIRLNTDGSLDNTFLPPIPTTYTIVLQQDGKIIVGGKYQPFKNMYFGFVDRIHADGSADSTFNRAITQGAAANTNDVKNITLHTDKILIGGHFSYCNDVNAGNIAQLNTDGTHDADFNNEAESDVFTTALLPSGNIIIAGDFKNYNQVARNHVARIIPAIRANPLSADAFRAIPADKNKAFLLYPNPASTSITIDNLASGSKLFVRNTLGKLVYAATINMTKTTLDLNTYANGVYFVTCENNGTVSNTKFIISR